MSWGLVKSGTLSVTALSAEEEVQHFFLFFSLFYVSAFSFRRDTRPVNTVSTRLLVCVFPHWICLHRNHIIKQKGYGKKGKGPQLNTHIRLINFGDIYNHSVINTGNKGGFFFFFFFTKRKDDLQKSYMFIETLPLFISV